MFEQLQAWWQQLSPGMRAAGRDGAMVIAALIAAPIAAAMVKAILRRLRFDLYLLPPWRIAELKRQPAGERKRPWNIPPTHIVGWLCLLTVWGAAAHIISAWHERGDIASLLQKAGEYVWLIAAAVFALMLIGAWFSRRMQDLVEIPWLLESIGQRLGGSAPAETFSFSIGKGISSLVYVIAVLAALLAAAKASSMSAMPEVLTALLQLAVGALAAVAALALGWIGVAWLRAEGRRSQDQEFGENSTHLAVVGTVAGTTLLAIILLASHNFLPLLLVVLALAAVLWLLRGESGEIVRRIGQRIGSLLKPPPPPRAGGRPNPNYR